MMSKQTTDDDEILYDEDDYRLSGLLEED